MRKTDFTGRAWGRLTVIGDAEPVIYTRPDGRLRSERQVTCKCECGTVVTLHASNVVTGNTKSCGCLRVEKSAALNRKHGETGSDTYRIYRHMVSRCYNPNVERYPIYGGRGVRVADEWRGDGGYERWLEHIGPRPSKSHSIDRIDNDGHYEPGNVRWATRQEQIRNRSCSLTCIVDGNVVSVLDAAKIVGMSYGALRKRLKTGCGLPQGVRKHSAD